MISKKAEIIITSLYCWFAFAVLMAIVEVSKGLVAGHSFAHVEYMASLVALYGFINLIFLEDLGKTTITETTTVTKTVTKTKVFKYN